MAADTVIASADNIVPVGVISPDHVVTPAPVVDYLVANSERRMEPQTIIARRIARELQSGMLVNLGIGIPTLVANYVPEGMHVFFQSENGLIGTGAPPEEGMAHPTLTDAGGRPVTALPGASTFDSAMSFGLIRGGHLDLTVLGGLQVDQHGHLANWMIPGKMVPGMGGAMDLVSGAKRVIVAMQHTAKGAAKIVKKCTLPITSMRPVDLVVTELAVIGIPRRPCDLARDRSGVSVAQVVAATEAELVIPDQVPEMILRHRSNDEEAPADDSCREGQAARRQERPYHWHCQRSVYRLGLRQGVPRARVRAGGDLSQREGQEICRAAGARARSAHPDAARRARAGPDGGGVRAHRQGLGRARFRGALHRLFAERGVAGPRRGRGRETVSSPPWTCRAGRFIRMAHLAEPLMKNGGTLFTMTYYGSQMVVKNYNIMGVAKAALEGAVRYMAAELGPKGIRVHAISPGPLATRAASGIPEFDALLDKAKAKAPARSLVSIDDVGVATALLAHDAAKLITGDTVFIDGGYHIID